MASDLTSAELADFAAALRAARAEAARYREALEWVAWETSEHGSCPSYEVHEVARATLAHQDGASRVPDGTDGEGGE